MACAFHPNGLFQKEVYKTKSVDLVDNGIQIEVKTINASPDEIERIKELKADSARYSLPKDTEYESRINTKFKQRVKKAKKQIKNNGIVYIIWDSTLVTNWEDRKKQSRHY